MSSSNSVSSYRDPRMKDRNDHNQDHRDDYHRRRNEQPDTSKRSINDSNLDRNISGAINNSMHDQSNYGFGDHSQSDAVPKSRSADISPHGAIPIELDAPSSETLNNNEGMDFELSWKSEEDSNSWKR